MLIRQARESDAVVITPIYNHAVLHTTAIWNDTPVDVANRLQWLKDRQATGYPLWVATDDRDQVIGYATYGDWRPWDGYRFTVEHSVYVHPDAQGQGVGKRLMQQLIASAREQGKHVMVAGIESGNTGSIILHQKLGFTESGTLREVGTKFGRWLDLTFMQLKLGE
ncbi:GNAT family N-acetyltransferase [Candidatus Pantoea multigeneris]|uniref:N-acetyltransferase family protein n=1 Tax=Candidatus Pantoea multigeneris TaxID=2608357 RepID=A0ABX0R9U2_9GAMM|nr:GNAT family N-acetyltransferase [Pantoea multigeneris]NIF22147.1 N-acetyltransferase family protein [Pantoea multigeneris]